ncbi:MAG TPA: methyltransferase domain-containing protein [Hyphomicrobiaceae bacterium]|nr:methyltransferase domain-containing protein [Hyphomicrobiaceae bacterium]
MDYDQTTMPATYDAARGYAPDVLRLWLDRVAAHAPPVPQVILDIGCGTGRFTHPLAERFQACVIGIDPSLKMLEAARSKPSSGRVEFSRASAEELPIEDGSADLVFMSMTLHHLTNRARAAREFRRVLRAQGRLIVRNATRDCVYPQAQFFHGFQAIVETELPSRNEVFALFEGAGLSLAAYEIVRHPLAASWRDLADKLALRADSFLARLPDAVFAAGIAALRAHAARHPSGAIIERVHLFVFGA